MFVYVFCTFVSGLIVLFFDNLWFDLRVLGTKIGDRLNVVFSLNVILKVWLTGLKTPTN